MDLHFIMVLFRYMRKYSKMKVKMKRNAITAISVLCLQHFLVDFICALSLYQVFFLRRSPEDKGLIYTFCAFALQMPLGILADRMVLRQRFSFIYIVLSVIFLAVGSKCSLILLGLGNALFHVGGGMITMEQDEKNGFAGRGLGSFVAPGAIGLALGSILNQKILSGIVLLLLALLTLMLYHFTEIKAENPVWKKEGNKAAVIIMLICFVVVILRSYVSLSVRFAWKDTVWEILLSVILVALGKAAGGFFAAKYTLRTAVIVSLLLSAVLFGFGNLPAGGMLAFFFFNMSMPITLYLLAKALPELIGFDFGLLTFGLFLGYVFCNYFPVPVTYGNLLGALASLVSLGMLLIALKAGE